MSQLDELQSQLTRSLAVLDVQDQAVDPSPKKQDLRATVKTDAMRATMHADMRLTAADIKKTSGVANPFGTRDYGAGLPQVDEDLDERVAE